MKVSVVVSAYNEEKKLEDCLRSVKKIAREIIVVDNESKDKTLEIAKKYTSKVYSRPNNPMLNVNKNFGFSKASGNWILSLDADERVSEELSDEISNIQNEDVNGYYIPRKNIIFGKWIKNTGWYPDYQLRLFKKDKGKFAQKHVHEMLDIEGVTSKLVNDLIHYNYESISQFLNKMINTYTISEAENLIKSGYKFNSVDIIKMPLSEFIKRFFAEKGYKDGMHGLVLSFLQSFYHFVVFLRLWENNKYPDDVNVEEILKEAVKSTRLEFKHWMYEMAIEKTKSKIKKNFLRVRRKILI